MKRKMFIILNRFFTILTGAFLLTTRFQPAVAQMKAPHEWANYDQVLGLKTGLRHYDFSVTAIQSSVSGNVLWPGESAHYTFQISNHLDKPVDVAGKVVVIRYGTQGKPNDVWWPIMHKMADVQILPVKVRMAANGFANIDIDPIIPETFGGYALVLDLGPYGRRLATSVVRTFAANPKRLQYPRQSLDDLGADFLRRVGVQAIRMGVSYLPTQHRDYQAEMVKIDRKLREYQRSNITVLLMFGEGAMLTPLGTPRSFLDSTGNFLKTKQDYAWLPQLDPDFGEFTRRLCKEYGWPKGPVTAVSLWNEPWEGISISGWQADMLRYREIYKAMADGVLAARKEGADVLVGGADSHSNAWDKLFADGKMTFLPIFDFCSIHYEGMESPVLYPEWNNRQSPKGRVKIWDTESWVGNTDDRIGLVVATNRSAGYDRSMGIYGGYLTDGSGETGKQKIRTAEGEAEIAAIPAAWSPAAAMAAVQHLIGEREFKELLFKNGLPWVMVFAGENGKPDDGTIVVCGDIGEAFGADNVLFREVRGLKEIAEKDVLRKKAATLPADSPERKRLEAELKTYAALTDGRMTFPAQPSFRLYDFYGNLLPVKNNTLEIPLTFQGYFLRTDGSKGSFDKLVAALKKARIEGYEPVEIIATDLLRPVDQQAELQLKITNILNRPLKGKLTVTLGRLALQAPPDLALQAHESRIITVKVLTGTSVPDNNYPLTVALDAGPDGRAFHEEEMHVNVIARRTISVDGKLDDWKEVAPQTMRSSGTASVSLTEAAWYPFKQFDTKAEGYANGYLAYDQDYFYFAAKVADNTPHPGTYRFETRPDDEFFYPDVAYQHNGQTSLQKKEGQNVVADQDTFALQKPEGRGRILHYWEAGDHTNSFGVDLSLPLAQLSRVSFYLPNLDVWKARLEVYDQQTGALLASHDCDKLWNGTYLSFDLSGKVRVVFQSAGWWYTVKLAGIFFDPTAGKSLGKTSAIFVKEDFDTRGNWPGVYGKSGHWVMGCAPALPRETTVEAANQEVKTALYWPEGVRHFSYRKDPVTPDNSGLGYAFDNVLLAFNVIPMGQDGLLSHPKGTMPRYIGYKCTDYEYALNSVASTYGGGTEIWRLLTPGLNRKHFFPRQPKSVGEGAVKSGKLVVTHKGSTRITECAIPWAELPDVKQALDEGRTIKFSFRVNDDGAGGACMELARERSVSKRNTRAFHPDWKEHWANEVEFGFEK